MLKQSVLPGRPPLPAWQAMPENLKAKRTEYAIEGAESRSCLKDSLAVSKQFPAPSEYLTIVQGE